MRIATVAAIVHVFYSLGAAQQFDRTSLVGTWTSKSGKVLTGPGFYDPVREIIFEPNITGISYSFTADGHYEEALYRAVSNPVSPSCTSSVLQWQHGSYTIGMNTTLGVPNLQLQPIEVDGREIYSAPCTQKSTIMTRYNMSETFSEMQVLLDPYNQQWRLNLFEWDGTPVIPMWLAFRPPQMLPTQTLNPTTSYTGVVATSIPTSEVRRAIHFGYEAIPQSEKTTVPVPDKKKSIFLNDELCFWLGIIITLLGSILVAVC